MTTATADATTPVATPVIELDQAEIKTVRLDDIFVDQRFQGPVNAQRVKEIVQNFDPDLLGYPVLSYHATLGPDEQHYSALDCQHRVIALKRLGKTHVQAQVLYGLSPEREARIFRDLNVVRRKTLAANVNAKALLASGDPTFKAIKNIVEVSGFRLALEHVRSTGQGHGSAYKNKDVAAVNALYTVYDLGADILLRVFTILKDAWGDRDEFIAHGNMIVGISAFLITWPESQDTEIARKLAAVTPTRMLSDARGDTRYNQTWRSLAYRIFDAYNHGKRKRLDERTVPTSLSRTARARRSKER